MQNSLFRLPVPILQTIQRDLMTNFAFILEEYWFEQYVRNSEKNNDFGHNNQERLEHHSKKGSYHAMDRVWILELLKLAKFFCYCIINVSMVNSYILITRNFFWVVWIYLSREFWENSLYTCKLVQQNPTVLIRENYNFTR